MKNKAEFILGILGGMGPMAGVEFQRRIIEKTPARADQDHIRMVCFTNPKIKDRTESLQGKGSYADEVVRSLNLMKYFRVNLGVMTCNTAHANFRKISQEVDFPLINMIDETTRYIARNFPSVGSVGILGTNGTVRAGLYSEALEKRGMQGLIPSFYNQERLMEIIYGRSGIKSGCINSNRIKVQEIIRSLENEGADVVVLGCTELSLLGICGKNIIDPLDVVAEKIVAQYLMER